MPKFLDNIEFYTEGYGEKSLTIEKETVDIVLEKKSWNKEWDKWNEKGNVELKIPEKKIRYPAEGPAKKKITDISRNIKEETDEAIYKIEALSGAGLNATNELVQIGLNALDSKTQTGLGQLQDKINELDPDKIKKEINALQQKDVEHNSEINALQQYNNEFNLENGTGDVLIQTKDLNHSFKAMIDGRVKVYGEPIESDDALRLSEFPVLTQEKVDSLF